MRRVYEFLSVLEQNNNREWFNAHKEEYLEAQKIFNNFWNNLIIR